MKIGNKKAHFSTLLGGGNEKKASSVNDRLTRYKPAKDRGYLQMNFIKYKLYETNSELSVTLLDENKRLKLVSAMEKCGQYLAFKDYYTVGVTILSKADFCKKHLLCPLCAIRRGAKYLQAYLPKYEQVTRDNNNLKAYMITLTVKNGDDLTERVQHLQKCYRKMLEVGRRFRDGKKGYKYTEASKALGGVFSTEVKRGSGSGQWHPHLHMVWLCENEPNLQRLAEEWKQYTGDSHIVDISPFYGDPVASFCEVFKYALKFSDMELHDTWEAFLRLSGKRLIDSFGILRGVKVDEDLLDQPLEDDLPYLETFYAYTEQGYQAWKAVDHLGNEIPLNNKLKML